MIDNFLVAAVIQLLNLVILFSSVFLLVPTHRHFFFSALGFGLKDSWIVFMACAVIEVYLTLRAAVLEGFYVTFGYFYVISVQRWLKKAW